jgi:hypothetical protein
MQLGVMLIASGRLIRSEEAAFISYTEAATAGFYAPCESRSSYTLVKE